MKPLWIASAMLAAVLCATLYNSWYMARLSDELTVTLIQAETLAERGEWGRAEALTRQAYDRWESQDYYLHITLRHTDTDQIHSGFREVLEFITCQEEGEYSAANARLITQIELVAGAEHPTLKNIL